MEYYSPIKRNEIMAFAVTWMDLETIILSEISQLVKHHIIYTWNLKKKKKGYKQTCLQNRNRLTDFKKLMVTKGDRL